MSGHRITGPRDKTQAVAVADMLWDFRQVHYLCVQETKFLVFLWDSKKNLSLCFNFLIICPYSPTHHTMSN